MFEVVYDEVDVVGEYVPWVEPKSTLLFECSGCGHTLEMFARQADEYVCPFCAQFMRCQVNNLMWCQDSTSSDALLQQGYYI